MKIRHFLVLTLLFSSANISFAQSLFDQVSIDRTLRPGTRGSDVALLQTFLATDPILYPDPTLITGYYGSLTTTAVAKLQMNIGLEPVGYVGPKTRAYINNQLLLNLGANGQAAAINARGGGKTGLNAPTDLVVSNPTSNSLKLNWVDNSQETNFEIERSTSATTGFTLVSTVPAESTSFINYSINPSTTYYYRVRARLVNVKNGSVTYSAYSNVAMGTTLIDSSTPPPPPATTTPTSTPPGPIGGTGTGAYLWDKVFVSSPSYNEQLLGVSTDGSGSIYATGFQGGHVSFGGGELASYLAGDAFIARFASDGSHIWSKGYGGSGTEKLSHSVVTSDGNVVAVGFSSDTAEFGMGSQAGLGGQDIIVAKYNSSDGAAIWVKRLGGSNTDMGEAISTDAYGDIYVTGYVSGTVDFGGGPTTGPGGVSHIFVLKLRGSDGSYVWAKRYTSGSTGIGKDITTDGLGRVIVTGYVQGSVDLGGGTFTPALVDSFLLVLDATTGNYVTSKHFANSTSWAVKSDSSNNIILAGRFSNTTSFGGRNLTESGGWDNFIAKFNSNGIHQWSIKFGGSKGDNIEALTVDSSGNAIISGESSETFDLGGGSYVGPYAATPYVAKYSGTDGAYMWSNIYANTGPQAYIHDLDMNSDGTVVFGGDYIGTMDFGGGPRTGSNDIFLVKINK